MKKMFKVLCYELASTFRQKGTMVAMIVISLILFVGPIIGLQFLAGSINTPQTEEPTHPGGEYATNIIIYDEADVISNIDMGMFMNNGEAYEIVASYEELETKYTQDTSLIAYHITSENSYTRLTSHDDEKYNGEYDVIYAILQSSFASKMLGVENSDYIEAQNLQLNVNYTNVIPGGSVEPETEEEGFGFLAMPIYFASAMVIYIVIIAFGTGIAMSIVKEKKNRLVEIFIISLKPSQLLFGKVLSYTLYVVFAIVLYTLLAISGTLIGLLTSGLMDNFTDLIEMLSASEYAPLISKALWYLGFTVIILVIALFVYFSLFAALGAIGNEIEDANASITPIMVIFIVSFIVLQVSSSDLIMSIMTYIPFSAPFAILKRLSIGSIGGFELALATTIFAIAGILLSFIAAKIYRGAVLTYGQKPGAKTILNILKG